MYHFNRYLCHLLLVSMLLVCPDPVFAQTPSQSLKNNPSNKAYSFAFTPAPSVLAQEVTVSGPDRVYIMEELKPTFAGANLHVADNELAVHWRNLFNMLEPLANENKLWLINQFVNQTQNNPAAGKAPKEDWKTPAEFFINAGHAGDYALTKYYALKTTGIPTDDLYLAFVKEPRSDALHVVLIVRRNDDFFVLDTVSDQPFRNSAPREYIPQYYANETTTWLQRVTLPIVTENTRNTATAGVTQPNYQQNNTKPDATNGKILLEGYHFDITPPPERDTGVNIHRWKRICDAEDRFPSFKGPEVNISDRKRALEWSSIYGKFRSSSLNKKIVAVNNFFNQWKYKTDEANWGQNDYWATPREFMEKSGDCEDYAIAKYFALRALNVPSKDICLVWVRVGGKRETHMVLIVLDKDDFYVLDNNTRNNIIYKNGGLWEYQPIYYMNENFAWKPAKNN